MSIYLVQCTKDGVEFNPDGSRMGLYVYGYNSAQAAINYVKHISRLYRVEKDGEVFYIHGFSPTGGYYTITDIDENPDNVKLIKESDLINGGGEAAENVKKICGLKNL